MKRLNIGVLIICKINIGSENTSGQALKRSSSLVSMCCTPAKYQSSSKYVSRKQRKKDYKSLVNARSSTSDPSFLRKWINERDGLKLWPAVSYLNIHMFLQQTGSTGLPKESLTAYKTGKAYIYFQCDWLKEVFYSPISKTNPCRFMKAE